MLINLASAQSHVCKVGNADPKIKLDPRVKKDPNCQSGFEFCGKEECLENQEYCISVFQLDESSGRLAPQFASCWETPTGVEVSTDQCVLKHRNDVENSIYYECWCTGNLCNSNIVFPKKIVNPTGKKV